jgi:hypothetical protein
VASRPDAARGFTIDERNQSHEHCQDDLHPPGCRFSVASIAPDAIAGMLGTVLSVSSASAYSCVRGVNRAGCVSQYGAVGWSRNGAVAVGRYGNVYAYHRGSGCFWRNGQRICF